MSVEKENCFFVVVIVGFTLAVSSTPFYTFNAPLLVERRFYLGWPWHVDGRQASSFMF